MITTGAQVLSSKQKPVRGERGREQTGSKNFLGTKNQENLTNSENKSLMREAQAWTKIKTEKPGQRSQKDYPNTTPTLHPRHTE